MALGAAGACDLGWAGPVWLKLVCHIGPSFSGNDKTSGVLMQQSRLALAVGLALLSVSASAQQAAKPAAPVPEVVVTGQAASLSRSIRAESAAEGVVGVVSANEIGALPDQNAAEAMARIPGVSLQRDQGEGRYVTIRGMDSSLNGVTINGSLVPSPEAGSRSVALDAIPSGIVASIEVQKTFSADQAVSGLGGVAEIKTLTAFDLPAGFAAVSLQSTRDSKTSQSAPGASVLISDRLMNGRLGLTLAVSRDRRAFGSDNVETGGAWDGDELEGLELRDYELIRTRTATSLNLDFKPSSGMHLYFRGLNTQTQDTETRDRYVVEWVDSEGDASPVKAGKSGFAESARRVKKRTETLKIQSLQLGVKRDLGAWSLDGAIGRSKATEDTPLNLDDARFTGFKGSLSFTDTMKPVLSSNAALTSPTTYKLKDITLGESLMNDEDRFFRLDGQHRIALLGRPAELSVGTRISRRTKAADSNEYESNAAKNPMSAFVTSPLAYSLGAFGLGLNADALFALGKSAGFERVDDASAESDSEIKEDIRAVYVQTRLEWSKATSVTAGLRYESTDLKTRGNVLNADEETIVEKRTSRSYGAMLPALQIRHALDAATTVRAAASRSQIRPGFEQLAPTTIVEDNEAERGNPNLKPLKSTNLDFSVQRLLGRQGMITANIFHKSIKDFTYLTSLGEVEGFDQVKTYANGDKGRLSGLELSYVNRFAGMPSPWNRFLMLANLAVVDGSATLKTVDDGDVLSRKVRFPGQSDRTSSLVVGYEHEGLSARVALKQQSSFLLELTDDFMEPEKDLYVDGSRHVDLSFFYQLNRNLKLGFEATNVTNQRYYVYQGAKAFNGQYEEYGRGYKVSVRASF